MPQIFHPSTNTISRVSIAAAVLALTAFALVGGSLQTSPYLTEVGVPREQPVPFSHKPHVAGLGIDCRYCHTSVEESSFAGIPPTETCMNCHRHPERYVRPRDRVFDMDWQPPADQEEKGRALMKEYRIMDRRHLESCDTCHR